MNNIDEVPESFMEWLRPHFLPGVAEEWLHRHVPAFDNMSPIEWVAAGRGTWDDIKTHMEHGFSVEVTT